MIAPAAVTALDGDGAWVTVDIDPCQDPRWVVLQQDGGSLFTSPPWLRAVAQTYGLEPRARVVELGGQPVAGIAFCELDDPLGVRRISVPFSDFHGPLGDLDAAVQLVDSFRDGLSTRFRIPQHRLPALDEESFHSVDRQLLHHQIVIPEVDDHDELFASLNPSVRQNVRRSRRAGVEVEMRTDIDAVREFYDLHVGIRTRKYRLLPQPFAFFVALHDVFEPLGKLHVALARLDGRVIAGIFYIESGSQLYYKFNASSLGDLAVRPNEQLLLAGMHHCLERELDRIDLGVSDADQPGLVRYKQRFAQMEQDVVTITTTPLVDTSPGLRSAFGQLTALLTDDRVPAAVAEDAGAILYRYFA